MNNKDLYPRFKCLFEKFGFFKVEDAALPYYGNATDGLLYRPKDGRKLKPLHTWLAGNGEKPEDKYYYAKLKQLDGTFKNKRVNRIIALGAVENTDPQNKTIADHINGDRHDNRGENLRWVTPSENARNRKKRGTTDDTNK